MSIANLFQAIEQADLEALHALLTQGADLDEVDILQYDGTPLSFACEHGLDAFVDALLQAGADVNRVAIRPPLVAAAEYGFATIVTRLLSAGADTALVDENGRAPLAVAAEHGFTDIARLLVEAGADVAQADDDGNTAVDVARICGHEALADYLGNPSAYPATHAYWKDADAISGAAARERRAELESWRAATSSGEDEVWAVAMGTAQLDLGGGFTVSKDFCSLAESGEIEAVRAMLADGLPPDWMQFRGHATALMCASRGGELEVVELLLGQGADPGYRTEQGLTALHYALYYPSARRHTPVVERLLAAGADPNAGDADGQRPLHLAIRHAIPSIVEALIAAGADPFITDAAGRTPADWLPERGKSVAAVRTILDNARQS